MLLRLRKENYSSFELKWLDTGQHALSRTILYYIVNLLHSRFEIDIFNILEGSSKGFEMINFLEEHLRVENSNGERRCCCIDFHHGVFAENK